MGDVKYTMCQKSGVDFYLPELQTSFIGTQNVMIPTATASKNKRTQQFSTVCAFFHTWLMFWYFKKIENLTYLLILPRMSQALKTYEKGFKQYF